MGKKSEPEDFLKPTRRKFNKIVASALLPVPDGLLGAVASTTTTASSAAPQNPAWTMVAFFRKTEMNRRFNENLGNGLSRLSVLKAKNYNIEELLEWFDDGVGKLMQSTCQAVQDYGQLRNDPIFRRVMDIEEKNCNAMLDFAAGYAPPKERARLHKLKASHDLDAKHWHVFTFGVYPDQHQYMPNKDFIAFRDQCESRYMAALQDIFGPDKKKNSWVGSDVHYHLLGFNRFYGNIANMSPENAVKALAALLKKKVAKDLLVILKIRKFPPTECQQLAAELKPRLHAIIDQNVKAFLEKMKPDTADLAAPEIKDSTYYGDDQFYVNMLRGEHGMGKYAKLAEKKSPHQHER